jgi:uncharacterized membrane protein YfhO
VEDSAGKLKLAFENASPTRLTIAERFHSGWRAVLDGRDIPIIRADNFMACRIPAGRHQFEMCFQPASLRIGGWLTLCGLGLTLSWATVAMLVSRNSV